MFQRVCVFCGSRPGTNGAFRQAAAALGGLLAHRSLTLIYGGGGTGIMGVLADAALAAGGHVIGVIPAAMNLPGIVHDRLSELQVVDSMHTRKATMAALADAFVALPGGLGTLDELFEILTWSQLHYHTKPIGILNVDGYYDPLITMIERAVDHGFILPSHRQVFVAAAAPADLIAAMECFEHPGSAH